MSNSNLHLLFKFNKIGKDNFETIEEHIKVCNQYGSVIWGHFSSDKRKKGLWQEKIEQMISQVKNGKESFVFFYDKKNSLLYCSRYIFSWTADEFDLNSEKINLVPSYYHDSVGLPADGRLRSYCYVEVDHIKQLDISNIKNILSNSTNISIGDNKGQNSVFYVHLSPNLESSLNKEYIDFNENIEPENIEASLIEDVLVTSNFTEINDIPKAAPNYSTTTTRQKIIRNSNVIANAISYSQFKCEVDESHVSFISKKTNQQFLEGHHLIPLNYQEEFIPYSLDVESNVVSLCPNCHRLLHHGTDDDKLVILKKLLNKRKERLAKANIKIDFNKLKAYYK